MTNLEKYGIILGRGKEYEEAIYSLALIYNVCDNRISEYLKKYELSIDLSGHERGRRRCPISYR